MTRVVILGAGVAGLAAAYRLLELQPHWEVYVFEQDRIIPVVLSAISIMKEKAKNTGGKTGVIHNF